MKARENPFRSERIERLPYRSPGFCWKELEIRLARVRGRGAVVGPEGHGKTTLLLEWRARREALGEAPFWLGLRYGQRRLTASQRAAVSAARVIFVDSAEQLGWPGWCELLFHARNATALVISSHRPGRLATIHTCRTSPELLQDLVNELGRNLPDCRELWARQRGNIRNALRELYDRTAA